MRWGYDDMTFSFGFALETKIPCTGFLDTLSFFEFTEGWGLGAVVTQRRLQARGESGTER